MPEDPTREEIMASMYQALIDFRKEINDKLDKGSYRMGQCENRLDNIDEIHRSEKPVWDTVNQIGSNVKKVGIWFVIATVMFFVISEFQNIIKFTISFINPFK